ncbi:Fpg/Nei family DNA glycosylase [Corynebacterium sp. 4HC-13]|uniref:Fpg/Nei family DNA glycosylase n=1 Tax=Corynebacterium anserum TaxID=2684406 RepID=UPI00163A9CBB|nr:Fpg/Nei family DNA glycosylase [Corynebacterium anserum]MBC2681236.1 Fpg/Nei family DNA glycosylase [Corynebacterium anserum]
MPEGHVIHYLARQLNQAFAGHVLRVTSPQGRFKEEASILNSTRFRRAEAWGKHLFLDFDVPDYSAGARSGARLARHIVHIHLGLIGSLRIEPYRPGPPVGQVRLHLHRIDAEGGEDMCMWGDAVAANLRGPQWCRLITDHEMDDVISRAGADPIRDGEDTNREKYQEVKVKVQRSGKAIGTLLMDQKLFAGVGNIYRAETLFRLGIDPQRKGRDMSSDVLQNIWSDLVYLMREGEKTCRIDTVREEHTPEVMGRLPRKDDHGGEVYVYRRAGQPCYVCGTPIEMKVVEGRNLFWCPGCQQ